MYLIIFFAPLLAVVAVVDELIYIDGGKFLSFINKARLENKERIQEAIKGEQGDKYFFHIGMDVAYGDILEYLRDD
jgi:hypothetical protein